MARDVAVFHPGVQHSWQTAMALQELDRLCFYATSIFYRPDRWPYRVERWLPAPLAARLHDEFRRFAGPPIDPARIETFGAAEWAERLARRLGRRRLATRLDRWGNRRFAGALTRQVGHHAPRVLWGYNGAACETFVDPRNAGRLRVLDRTIGDWRAYNAAMEAIHDRYRAFFPPGPYRVPAAQIERDDIEYANADVIVTGSPFAAATVRAGCPAAVAKLCVLPYSYDAAQFEQLSPPSDRRDGPVRFLFVGQIGPRKGIHLVLEAFARLPAAAATLTLVGDLQVPSETFARYADRVTHQATVPRRDVPVLMQAADVLLFPSYFEGSALSLLEGLAAGLALVQSAEAGLGVTPATGLLLPELSVEAVHDAMLTLIDDRPRLAAFRAAAQTEARRYSFAAYRDRIAALLADLAPDAA